jgi:hypothetical protein
VCDFRKKEGKKQVKERKKERKKEIDERWMIKGEGDGKVEGEEERDN